MVPEGLLIDRFLCSEGKTTSTNHYHDEQVKIAQVHYKVTEATNTAKKENPNVLSQLTVKVEIIVLFFFCFSRGCSRTEKNSYGLVGPNMNMEL